MRDSWAGAVYRKVFMQMRPKPNARMTILPDQGKDAAGRCSGIG